MARRDWLERIAARRVDRRQAGLLGMALLALLSNAEPATARKRDRVGKRDRPGPGEDGKRPWACGGLLGLTCPRGFQCVDDPSDDCNPPLGADCIGRCVRRRKDICSRVRCREGTKCCAKCDRVCIPEDVPCTREGCGGERCNEAICDPGEYCCNESCSRCVPIGSGCTKELCPPKPDDGEPCGRNRCDPGERCCSPACGVCAPKGRICPVVRCLPDPGGERCGNVICPRDQYCCNASCSMCAPRDAACIQIACEEEE